jgi:hypothetical protein
LQLLRSNSAALQLLRSNYAALELLRSNYAALQLLRSNYAALQLLRSNSAALQLLRSNYAALELLRSNYAALQILRSNYGRSAPCSTFCFIHSFFSWLIHQHCHHSFIDTYIFFPQNIRGTLLKKITLHRKVGGGRNGSCSLYKEGRCLLSSTSNTCASPSMTSPGASPSMSQVSKFWAILKSGPVRTGPGICRSGPVPTCAVERCGVS